MTLRRFAPLLPSLLGVAAVIAGLAYATSVSGPPVAGPYVGAVPLPSPHSIVRNGQTYVVQQTVVVAASPRADPRVVTFYVFATGPSAHPLCDALSPRLAVVSEDSRSVVVAGFSYQVRSPGHGRKGVVCTFGSVQCSDLPYTAITVRLDAPLAERFIVDAKSGRHVGVLNGQRLPRVGYVPAGYHLLDDEDFDEPERLDAPCTTEIELAYENRAGHEFDVSLGSASELADGPGPSQAVDVNGRPGRMVIAKYDHCVTWEQPLGLQHRVCTAAKHPLPTDELIKVARSLH